MGFLGNGGRVTFLRKFTLRKRYSPSKLQKIYLKKIKSKT